MTCYRTGGQVNAVPADAMAFAHRSSRWIVTTDIDWTGEGTRQDVADNLDWQRNVQNHFPAMLGNPGSYYNFPDPELPDHARVLGRQPGAAGNDQAPDRSEYRVHAAAQSVDRPARARMRLSASQAAQ
jgi:hypothetical protein